MFNFFSVIDLATLLINLTLSLFLLSITLKQVEKALIHRDKEDIKRKISPLIMTKNAVLVDTTKLTIKQMEVKLINLVKNSIYKKYGNL